MTLSKDYLEWTTSSAPPPGEPYGDLQDTSSGPLSLDSLHGAPLVEPLQGTQSGELTQVTPEQPLQVTPSKGFLQDTPYGGPPSEYSQSTTSW